MLIQKRRLGIEPSRLALSSGLLMLSEEIIGTWKTD